MVIATISCNIDPNNVLFVLILSSQQDNQVIRFGLNNNFWPSGTRTNFGLSPDLPAWWCTLPLHLTRHLGPSGVGLICWTSTLHLAVQCIS